MKLPFLAATLFLASPALAEVKSATSAGFEVVHTATIAASPADIFAALGRIGAWWSSDHSYSGDARNMTIELRAGGCFCEAIPPQGGSVEHMRVVWASPGKALRLRGGLGPLQGEGGDGALTWTIEPAPGGAKVDQSYVFGGYVRGGAEKLAPLVDKVLGEQLSRLNAYLEKSRN